AAEHLGKLAERHISQEIADIAPLLAVLCQLAVADLVHGRVVADDGKLGNPETVGGLHVKSIHAKRAVAVVAEHFFIRIGQTRGNGEPRTYAQRAQGTGIHPLSWSTWPHRLGRDGDNVATVTDIDSVLGQELVELV